MKNKLEQLLNSLIEKGWKPFGDKCKTYEWIFLSKSTRDLASKESGLWQFVCENGMIKKKGEYRAKRRHLHGWEHDEDVYHDISYTKNDYEYYIIESSLKDESELEEFLLSNIKVEGK